MTQAANGKVRSKQHRTFSADGKTMTMNITVHRDDGTTANVVTVRQRKSGTKGLVGEWVNAKVTPKEPTVQTITVKGDMLHLESQHSKDTVDAKLDGSEGKVAGPTVPPGLVASYKSVSANELDYSYKLSGKTMDEGTLTLSPDGKTLTDVSWMHGKESEKTTAVFDKQ
jgi:hypothetical protein